MYLLGDYTQCTGPNMKMTDPRTNDNRAER